MAAIPSSIRNPDIRQTAPESGLRTGVVSPHMEFRVMLAQCTDGQLPIDAYATAPDDAAEVLASCSHVILDLNIVDSTEALEALLAGCAAHVLVVVPSSLTPDVLKTVMQTPGASHCMLDSELPGALARMFAFPPRENSGAAGHSGPEPVPAIPAPPAIGGWRSIAVWGLEGGIGKTLLTRALGLDCAARGHKALVVGLGSPDMLPLRAGLNPEPGLAGWMQEPRADILQQQVQTDGNLDLLAGFLSPPALSRFAMHALEGETSLQTLAMQTARLGYAAVILDVSAQELAAPALQAVNTLVLVGSATAQGAVAIVEAYRLARHEIGLPAAHCHLVLNRCRTGHLTPHQFTSTVRTALRDIPEPVIVLPEETGADERLASRPGAVWGSDSWRQSIHHLGDMLFGTAGQAAGYDPEPVHETRFGPLVFRKG